MQVVAFLDGVKLPAINNNLDHLSSASDSSSNGRPTATNDALPMLNLCTTSRKRLNLVFENKKGRAKRLQRAQEEATVQFSDSEDEDVDQVPCAACKLLDYSMANPILLCDGDGCGKGMHLGCLRGPAKKKEARDALAQEIDWFCSDGCKTWLFESIEGSRIVAGTSTGQDVKEYLIKWEGYAAQTWEPASNVPTEELEAYEQQSHN